NYSLSFANKWHYRQTFATQSALDSAFNSGVYTISFDGAHDGFRSLPLNLPADSFPPAPHVSNYTATQAINPVADFNFTWDAFAGAVTGDDLAITVYDGIGDTYASSNLTNTATSFQLVANTLTAGQSYYAILTFMWSITNDTATYPGATGSVFFSSQTYLD